MLAIHFLIAKVINSNEVGDGDSVNKYLLVSE